MRLVAKISLLLSVWLIFSKLLILGVSNGLGMKMYHGSLLHSLINAGLAFSLSAFLTSMGAVLVFYRKSKGNAAE